MVPRSLPRASPSSPRKRPNGRLETSNRTASRRRRRQRGHRQHAEGEPKRPGPRARKGARRRPPRQRHERMVRRLEAGPKVVEREPEGGGSRRGERRTGRLNTDPNERIAPQNEASKSRAARVAAGSPVSAYGPTAWGQGPATSREPLRIGRTPWTAEHEPWTWLRDETSPWSRRRSKPPRG
jgi:hypothetical protein